MAMIDMLCAVSPLDGRYGSKVDELREVFSEYGLVKDICYENANRYFFGNGD